MKNNLLIYALFAYAAFYILNSKGKTRDMVVTQPDIADPGEVKKPSLIKKAANLFKEVAPVVKQVRETKKEKKATAKKVSKALSNKPGSILKGIGQFPDMC